MNDEKTVAVSLRDLCDISAAVSGMMHDLDNDDMDHPYVRIDVIHVIVEGWVSDGAVLGGGCHPNHRCWLCTDDPGYFEWIRSRMQTPHRGPGEVLTAGLSARLEMDGTSTYDRRGDRFLLEHVSEAVVRVIHDDRIGHFGIGTDPMMAPDRPYTRTMNDGEVSDAGISGRPIFHWFATPKAALDSTCAMILDVPDTIVDIRPLSWLPEAQPGEPDGTTMSDEAVVAVALNELCVIADAMTAMVHNLDNGKLKNVAIELERIHTIVEGWAHDENVLGGAGCHDDHRCRLCRDFPVLAALQATRLQPAVPASPRPSVPAASRGVKQSGTSDAPTPPRTPLP